MHQLKDTLHDMNNALNAISMQSELAHLYCQKGDLALAQAALDVIMAECRRCSSLSHSMQSDLANDSD